MEGILTDFVPTSVCNKNYRCVCLHNRQEYNGPTLKLPASDLSGLLLILNNNLIEWDVICEGSTLLFIYNNSKVIMLENHFYNIAVGLMYHLDLITGRPTPPPESYATVRQSTVLFRAVNTVIYNVIKPENKLMHACIFTIHKGNKTFHFKGCIVEGFLDTRLISILNTAFRGWGVAVYNGLLVFNPNPRNTKMFDNTHILDAVRFLNSF